MEVVNNNAESKWNILEYLKTINVNSSNKNEEIELDNYIASIIMIVTSTSILNNSNEEGIIYHLFQDKKDNKIYGKFFNKEFTNKNKEKNEKDKVNKIENNSYKRANEDNGFNHLVLFPNPNIYYCPNYIYVYKENKDSLFGNIENVLSNMNSLSYNINWAIDKQSNSLNFAKYVFIGIGYAYNIYNLCIDNIERKIRLQYE